MTPKSRADQTVVPRCQVFLLCFRVRGASLFFASTQAAISSIAGLCAPSRGTLIAQAIIRPQSSSSRSMRETPCTLRWTLRCRTIRRTERARTAMFAACSCMVEPTHAISSVRSLARLAETNDLRFHPQDWRMRLPSSSTAVSCLFPNGVFRAGPVWLPPGSLCAHWWLSPQRTRQLIVRDSCRRTYALPTHEASSQSSCTVTSECWWWHRLRPTR